ncbi:MAG: MurR/RpiR family transcriptional regulator [Bacteroidetes bacterium]|nr:MurR/RpiR family transcriptional regulator [Bacteroidota bacterium]
MVESGDFKQLIAGAYPSLTTNQKKVADYLLNNMREAAFLSVTDIGDRCGASKATVVRFAQELGFQGFIDFREKLSAAVNSEFDYLARLPLRGDNHFDSLFMVAKQDVDNINETINSLNPESVRVVIDAILTARTVFAAGLGISHLLSDILSYTLSQVSVRSFSLRHDFQSFAEQLHQVTPDDLLILFSFPPYSSETIVLASEASKRKIRVVAITNKMTAPVTEYADYVLPVKSDNLIYTNSIASCLVIINAFATEIAIRNKQQALKHLQNTNDAMTRSGLFFEKDHP